MISKRLEEAINAQINAEMWSAYLYLSMSAYCQDKGYAGLRTRTSTSSTLLRSSTTSCTSL